MSFSRLLNVSVERHEIDLPKRPDKGQKIQPWNMAFVLSSKEKTRQKFLDIYFWIGNGPTEKTRQSI